MLKTKLTEMLGIKHPIIQAGMGPFSNNNLCVASANAGVLAFYPPVGFLTGRLNRLFMRPLLKAVKHPWMMIFRRF